MGTLIWDLAVCFRNVLLESPLLGKRDWRWSEPAETKHWQGFQLMCGLTYDSPVDKWQ